jgi:hypothetical protein
VLGLPLALTLACHYRFSTVALPASEMRVHDAHPGISHHIRTTAAVSVLLLLLTVAIGYRTLSISSAHRQTITSEDERGSRRRLTQNHCGETRPRIERVTASLRPK